MEPESSSPCSEQIATGSYPEHVNPVQNLPPYLFKIHSNIILPPTTRFPGSSLFLSGFPNKTLYAFLMSPMHATCLARLILDFVKGSSTQRIRGKELLLQ